MNMAENRDAAYEANGHYRVLFVDDEPPVARVCTVILERQGCRVKSSNSSEEALAIFRETPNAFDVVLTDLSMPGMTGLALAEALRAVRTDIPIIMMSGYGAADILAEAHAAGVEHVISKPIDMKSLGELVTRVAAYSRANAGSGAHKE